MFCKKTADHTSFYAQSAYIILILHTKYITYMIYYKYTAGQDGLQRAGDDPREVRPVHRRRHRTGV